jgi:hypothetical protein
MSTLTGRRTIVVAALACAALGAGAAVAIQAAASAGGSSVVQPGAAPAAPNASSPPPVRPRTASGALAPTVVATNAHCGQTITKSLTLNGDLFCNGAGLIVSGASVILNLNGHMISGNGTNNGVVLTGATETLKNGVVTEFQFGVRVEGTTDTVSTVRSTYSTVNGIGDFGQSTKLTSNVVYGTQGDGIYSLASTATYTGNHSLNNTDAGIVLGGGGSSGVVLTSNVTNGNAAYGIYDFDSGTKLTGNTANFNGRDGIWVDEVAVIDGGTNTAHGNDDTTGVTAEECYGVVCS